MVVGRDRTLWVVVVLWLLLSGAAVYAMADYGAESGKTGVAPSHWPDTPDFMIQPDPARPTLILFAHPLCPCTRASLWELESITNRLFGMINLHVLFYEPEDASPMPGIWAASDLKQLAATLPGTQLHTDRGGRVAEKFGAYTSGQLLLYGTDQTLQFAGGITPSRGHMGSNPGKAAVISAILADEGVDLLAPHFNPVFGCSLHEEAKGDRKLVNEPTATNDLSSAY